MYIYIYIERERERERERDQNLLKIKQSKMDGKICQNIKPPAPTHIPSSTQLSTWGRLED